MFKRRAPRHVPLGRQFVQLPPVGDQHSRVQAIGVGRRRAIDPQIDLDRAALDLLADGGFDLRLERVVAFRRAVADLEVAAIDRPQLDRHGDAVFLRTGLAESGHAEQQETPRNVD